MVIAPSGACIIPAIGGIGAGGGGFGMLCAMFGIGGGHGGGGGGGITATGTGGEQDSTSGDNDPFAVEPLTVAAFPPFCVSTTVKENITKGLICGIIA